MESCWEAGVYAYEEDNCNSMRNNPLSDLIETNQWVTELVNKYSSNSLRARTHKDCLYNPSISNMILNESAVLIQIKGTKELQLCNQIIPSLRGIATGGGRC